MRVRRRGTIIDLARNHVHREIFGKGACIWGRILVVEEIPLERLIACFGCKGQDTVIADLERHVKKSLLAVLSCTKQRCTDRWLVLSHRCPQLR